MDELKTLVMERLNNKFLFAFIVAFVAWNYEAVSFFILGKYEILDKLNYMSSHFNDPKLLWKYPLLSAAAYVFVVPWIQSASEAWGDYPTYLRESASLKYQHSLLRRKQSLTELESSIRDRKQKYNEHDISIFNANDSLISQDFLINFKDSLSAKGEFNPDDIEKLREYIQKSRVISNQYSDFRINRLHEIFLASASDLVKTIADSLAYFAATDHQGILRMRLDPANSTHDRLDHLMNYVDKMYDDYIKYRTEVKREMDI